MEDEKLTQKCWVVLEDCFKGFGVVSDYKDPQTVEHFSNPINCSKPFIDDQCVSNSNRPTQHTQGSSSEKGNKHNRSKIRKKKISQPSVKVKFVKKVTTKKNEIKIPTTKSYVSLLSSASPWGNQAKSFKSLISLIHGETPVETVGITPKFPNPPQSKQPVKLVPVCKQVEAKTCDNEMSLDVIDTSRLAAASKDNFILDPKNGTLYNSCTSTDDFILDPKDGKLYPPEASTEGYVLNPKDEHPSQPTTSDNFILGNRNLSKTATSTHDLILAPENGELYTPEALAEDLNLDSEHSKLCTPSAAELIWDPNEKEPLRSTPPANEELILNPNNGELYTNPLCSMPTVGLTVDAGIGHPLPSLSAKCVLTCLDHCKSLMTSEYAEFCCAVVKSSSELKTKRMILPIKDDRVLQLMQIKWNSKSTVKQVSLSAALNAPTSASDYVTKSETNLLLNKNCDRKHSKSDQPVQHLTNSRKTFKKQNRHDISNKSSFSSVSHCDISLKRTKMSLLDDDKKKVLPAEVSDQDVTEVNSASLAKETGLQLLVKRTNTVDSDNEDMRTVTKKTAFEVAEAPYDPDDTRGIDNSEEKAVKPKEVTRGRTSHVMHELRRLNVAVFDMPASLETVACRLPDICRLGCVCSSLLARVVRENCGLEKCIFGCICLKAPSFDRGNQSYTWVQNKAKQNLAKEERIFKQTVVRSGKDALVLVEGKRKREIKMPKKYSEDFVSCADLRQSKTSKELFHDEEIPKKVSNQTKQTKRVKLASNTNVPSLPVDKENSPNSSIDSTDREPYAAEGYRTSELVFTDSARTAVYDYKSSKAFQSRQKHLETNETTKKIYAKFDLSKFAPTESLNQKDWKGLETVPSCSYLFHPEYLRKNPSKVNILPCNALWNDIANKIVFVWYQAAVPKPKIYLTNSPTKPFYDCLDLQVVDETSEIFISLPYYLKALKTGYVSGSTNKVGWVVKYTKSHWMIMGHVQQNQPSGSGFSDKSELTCNNEEVDILPSTTEDYPSRWWVMDLTQNFDLIYFMDFQKALTKRQMNTLLRLSVEYPEGENKVHRILLNRHRPKSNDTLVLCPDFGAYSVSNHPNKVFIGPYHSFKEPKFQVYSQKAAPNGKTQYVGVPLFYCGATECVRVTSQGVLSLHSESLPDVYVQGFWYQGCGNNLRESSEKPQLVKSVGELGSHTKEILELSSDDNTDLEILDITGDEGKTSSEIIDINDDDCDDSRKNKATNLDAESYLNLMEQVDDDEESSVDLSVDEQGNENAQPTLQWGCNGNELHDMSENTSVSVLQNDESMSSSSVSVVSSQDESDDEDESGNQNDTEKDLKLEYLIPNEPKIGYVTLTHLPGGAISVPHFTEAGTLKFYHHKSEIVNELNRLIHKKLSCLSRKCSVYLQSDDMCKCISWSFSKCKPECESVLEFTPEIFNGFFMLTNYGLLDLRSTQESIVQDLGKDWVDWMKNDQIRLKLQHWKNKEEQEVLERKLKTILSSNKDLPLFEVLSMATSEIAKLKAEDQLLDYESQSQKLLKETLISSLCRKLDGIPVDVVPKFLEHLEFSLLWEVLECMDNRKTILISIDKPEAPPPDPLSLHDDCYGKLPSAPGVERVKKMRGKKRLRSRNVNTKLSSKAAPNSETVSPRRKALKYMERLREEIRLEEEQKVKSHKKKPQIQLQKLQNPPKKVPKAPEQISLQNIDHIRSVSPESNLSSNSANDSLQLKDGIACKISPFSRINICVEEGGIKYLATSPPLPRSPEKPNILRKSRGPVGGLSPVANLAQKQQQGRKQVFPKEQGEEPLYLEDPLISTHDSFTTPLIPDSDPISSLCITSVVSEAKTATDPVQDVDQLSPVESSSELSNTLCQENLNSFATNCKAGKFSPDPASSLRIAEVFSSSTLDQENFNSTVTNSKANESTVDPVSSLRIANVFSTSNFPPTDNSSCVSTLSDPVSSLRISSVKSGVFPISSAARVSSSVLAPSSTLPASKASGDSSASFVKPKVIGIKNRGLVVGRSFAGHLKKSDQLNSIPTSSVPKSIIVCSKTDEKLVQNIVPKSFKMLTGETVPSRFIASDKKLKTVCVLKDSGYITVQSEVPTPKVWTQSILNKTAESTQFVKKQSNVGEVSSHEDNPSKVD